MSKVLKIQGVIEPEMLDYIARQIEEQDIKKGDEVDVLFNSEGGVVDVAFNIAGAFEEMQDAGIQMRAVAEGKVWSSAIVPFLSIEDRVVLKGGSFLIHKATYPQLNDVDKDQLRAYTEEIESYTEMLYDYYDDHGVVREVRSHLKQGEDLVLNKPDDIIKAGFVNKLVDEAARMYNMLRRVSDRVFPSSPNFSYIINSQTIQENLMTNKQIKGLVADAIKEAIPDIIRGVATVVNEMSAEPEEEPTNEVAALSADELSKLEGSLYKTPAAIDGQDEVAYVMHFGNDLGTAGTGQPLNSEGAPISLPDGEYVIKVGDSELAFNISNGCGKMNAASNEVPAEEASEKEEKPEEAPTNEDTPAEEEKEKPVAENKKITPPKPKNLKVPTPAKNTHAAEMHKMFEGYGAGCVGSK